MYTLKRHKYKQEQDKWNYDFCQASDAASCSYQALGTPSEGQANYTFIDARPTVQQTRHPTTRHKRIKGSLFKEI